MAITIDQSFIDQFSDSLHMLVEQKESKVRPTVITEMANGEKHFFDRLGSFEVTEVVGHAAPTPTTSGAHSRRMATVKKFAQGVYVDDLDRMKMMIDPTDGYTRKLASAHARAFDVDCINSMLGAAATGRSGSGSQAFDSNQQIAHGSAGMTVAKFNQALRILETNDVDVDSVQLYLLAGARAVEDLLGDTSNQFTSFDYQAEKPLSGRKMPNFRGVNIVRCQRIPDETAATTYRTILYTSDTLKVAIARDIAVRAAEVPERNFSLLVYASMSYGSVRMEEDTIVDILYQ